MIPTVHILASCLDLALLPSTLLVFKTLRIGFPTAKVVVWCNGLAGEADDAVKQAAHEVGAYATYTGSVIAPQVHGQWMADRIEYESGPLVFVDTDMVFHAPVEGWRFETGIAGRYLRRYLCPFTRCVTEPRLHTSLLFVDPDKLRGEMDVYGDTFHESPFNPLVDLWPAVTLPERTRAGVVNHFYDTACLAYQAVGGTSFTPSQLDAYDHLFAGTYLNALAPALTDCDLSALHAAAHRDPASIRGAWRSQNDWYARHAC